MAFDEVFRHAVRHSWLWDDQLCWAWWTNRRTKGARGLPLTCALAICPAHRCHFMRKALYC